jgi:outer membrane protein assembly factor BamB
MRTFSQGGRFAFLCFVTVILFLGTNLPAAEGDWPVFGRNATRNSVVPDGMAPTDWSLVTRQNIRWSATLGSATFAAPVVADGQVYIGTNNGAGYLERYPATVDLGCLLCFRESDGQFLWQYSAEKLPTGRVHDWPLQGLVSSPMIEGDRLWLVSNRHVLVCLDTQGFRDAENDGPYTDEPVQDSREADIVWQVDLMKELGVFPHPPGMGPNTRCSIGMSLDHRIFVVTGNGTDESRSRVPAPHAPSLVCFDKTTGQVLWADASPGSDILDCQASHPLIAQFAGRAQVIVGQGDGWVRSFDAAGGKLLWKFDINPKQSVWRIGGNGTRNYFLATPVAYQDRVYIASGQQAEHGDGVGRLVCINPTMEGDISSELAVNDAGQVIPHRRVQAVDPQQGERAIPNSNSGMMWEFSKMGDGEEYIDNMHRTLTSVVIHEDLVIAADFGGIVHCLDAMSGRRYWSHDMLASIWATPLIVDKTVYVVDEDGDVAVFRLSADLNQAMITNDGPPRPIAEVNMDGPIYSPPIFANGVLYIATRSRLHAIFIPPNKMEPPDHVRIPMSSGESDRRPDLVNVRPIGRSIFSPTPHDIVDKMLGLAGVTKGDRLVDLGCGDGRIVIAAAAKHGAHAMGYEIDAELAAEGRRRVKQSGLDERVEIRSEDMFTANLRDANVATVFLYSPDLEKLKPQFAAMHAGSRIVSHHFAIPGAKPDRVVTVTSTETGNEHRLLLYILPLR